MSAAEAATPPRWWSVAGRGLGSRRHVAARGFKSLRRFQEHGFSVSRRSAEHGFTTKRSAENGFTLVELMVVIVIIGLMSAAVVLTMADPSGRVTSEADRFAGRVRAARDSAIVSARPIAMWVSQSGYGFEQRRAGAWVPVTEGPLVTADWAKGTLAEPGQGGRARVVFDTVGRADQPLDMALVRNERRLRVRMDLDGKVTTGG